MQAGNASDGVPQNQSSPKTSDKQIQKQNFFIPNSLSDNVLNKILIIYSISANYSSLNSALASAWRKY